MKTKICGITTLDDAQAAVEAGADILGFVFYPNSPRYISPGDCASLVDGLSARGHSMVTVGVFVNESVEMVYEILDICGLDLAQLHGDETENELKKLKGKAYKAVRPRSMDEANMLFQRYAGVGVASPGLLLDAYRVDHYGGTGTYADWNICAQLSRRTPLLLAGGLRAENVKEALEVVKPWGVDVSSGVESSPGEKDWRKLHAFVGAVREYEKENQE